MLIMGITIDNNIYLSIRLAIWNMLHTSLIVRPPSPIPQPHSYVFHYPQQAHLYQLPLNVTLYVCKTTNKKLQISGEITHAKYVRLRQRKTYTALAFRRRHRRSRSHRRTASLRICSEPHRWNTETGREGTWGFLQHKEKKQPCALKQKALDKSWNI